ncbi:hypothetical protein SAMN06298226_0738 [Nitrosovibrio sp. Nv4]|nr:hypothetical protein SAMN06298226_0738 [Nitrosovibrio sp. Nv4]
MGKVTEEMPMVNAYAKGWVIHLSALRSDVSRNVPFRFMARTIDRFLCAICTDFAIMPTFFKGCSAFTASSISDLCNEVVSATAAVELASTVNAALLVLSPVVSAASPFSVIIFVNKTLAPRVVCKACSAKPMSRLGDTK